MFVNDRVTLVEGFGDEVDSSISDVLEHLETEHPDSLSFVASHVAGLSAPDLDATATFTHVSPTQVRLSLTNGELSREGSVTFASPVDDVDGLSAELFAMLAAARSSFPEHALTSIEREVESTAELTTEAARVVRRRVLAEDLVEVTLSGVDYAGLSPDAFVYVMTPEDASADLLELDHTTAKHAAYYTIRAHRPTHREIDLWVVDHDERGGAGRALISAPLGTPFAVWGPRSTHAPPADVQRQLLVCDATGFGAVASIIDGMPVGQRALVIALFRTDAHRPPLPEHPAVEYDFIVNASAETDHTAVSDALSRLDETAAGLYVFGAGEHAQMRELRSWCSATGVGRRHRSVVAYWRRGR